MRLKSNPEVEQEDPLPEEAETAVWVGHGPFHCHNPRDYEDDPLMEDVDLQSQPKAFRPDEDGQPTVLFDPGEPIPLGLARDCWADMSGEIALVDSDGVRLDDPDPRNEDDMAFERYRMQSEIDKARSED